uniref:Uncharacterized protein n=1 Tax=viral metagenome TaxID=1070528 RepID=A0A6M3LF77_9ZZZZ
MGNLWRRCLELSWEYDTYYREGMTWKDFGIQLGLQLGLTAFVMCFLWELGVFQGG